MSIDKDAEEKDGQERVDTVQVAVRIRPLVQSELSRGCELCLETVPNEPQLQVKGLAFTYNHVFPPEVTQEAFYNRAIKGMVKRLYKGYNVTILAYGQTGSGKTYSMGTSFVQTESNFYEAGVIPRAVADIFQYIDENSEKFDFKVGVSFMELYQEQLYDLLSTQSREKSIIDIREDHKGIVLPGLTEEKVNNAEDTISCLVRGSEGRATGATAMNVKSSRSHAIFTVHISKVCKEDSNLSTFSKFHLVDLAGSERSKKTKATGNRFKEGVKINQGLLALGNVISALGEGNKGFVCYRDSKLTRLLQDSLGGNSVTLMIACVSPADYNLEETISTLRYADRARRIQNKPIVNQDANSAEIIRLKNVIQELRLQVLGDGSVMPENYSKLREQLDEEKLKYNDIYEKYLHVVSKNKTLTNYLQKYINDNANMAEKAMQAEIIKEDMQKKLSELTQECDKTIEHLKSTDKSDISEEMLSSFCRIRSKIAIVDNEEKSILDPLIEDVKVEVSSPKNGDLSLSLDETEFDKKEEVHMMNQVAKNDELNNMMKIIADKMNLAEILTANNQELVSYGDSLKESEEKISTLEKEKENLIQLLKINEKKSKPDRSILNEQQSKVKYLEQQISELRKKCTQQANFIKLKEKNDLKITLLNNEIQQMKAAKVRLIRAMRSENERFRTWKLQSEKQISKLCNQDRKMQSAMVKMENKYTKQHAVLKRKMEDAIITNKRLKEALDRQKNTQKQHSLNPDKIDVIQNDIKERLELLFSVEDAKKTLEGLMNDRGTLNIQLESLKESNAEASDIETLHEAIQLRSAQIADLQKQVLAAEEHDNILKAKLEKMQSMTEARCALKYLFKAAINTQSEVIDNKFKKHHLDVKFEDLNELYNSIMKKSEELQGEMNSLRVKHRKEMSELDKQHAEKVTTLINQLNNQGGDPLSLSPSRKLLDRMEILTDVLTKANLKKAELEGENAFLRQENDSLKTSKRKKSSTTKKKVLDITLSKMYLDDDPEDEADDDSSKDPDWRKTPMFRRIQARTRATLNVADEKTVVKRSSEGQTKCSCKTNCSTKQCSCRKLQSGCGPNCRCDSEKCANQDSSSNLTDSTKDDLTESSKEFNDINTTVCIDRDKGNDLLIKKQKLIFANENDSSVINSEKKKRNFFYDK